MIPLPDIWITLAWLAPLPGAILLFIRMVGGGLRPTLRMRLRALGWPLLLAGLAAMSGLNLWNVLVTGDSVGLTFIASALAGYGLVAGQLWRGAGRTAWQGQERGGQA